MNKGPGLFSQFGQNARYVLNKDYSADQKFSISSQTEAGLTLNSTLVKRGGLSSGDVATQFKHKNAAIGLKFDSESNVLSSLVVKDILPSTNAIASMKLPDYNSGKVEVQYSHEHATLTTAVALKQSPTVDISTTIGTPTIAFGAEASYATALREFAKYNAGLSVTKPDSNATVILADKGDSLNVSYLHYLDQLKKRAIVGEISRKFSTNENTLTVGSYVQVDPHTIVKAKLNNHGNLGALLQHEFRPKSFLIVSGAFDTKALEKSPKFGLALTLKP